MSKIYQLKITLQDSKPPIWRRVCVDGESDLYTLHEIIQIVMGWTNSHLHQFIIQQEYYSEPDPFAMRSLKDEREFQLAQVVPQEKITFVYEYDFGDNWAHQILVEKIFSPEPGISYPICVKGKHSCPPEDVGGMWGYAHFLEAINDPTHEEHESFMEWWGEPFDPEDFDLEETNKALRRLI